MFDRPFDGLSVQMEFKNGSPLWFDRLILSYHEIIVYSDGASLPCGIVAVRYIFSMMITSWKTPIPFVSADEKHGIIDVDTDISIVEICEEKKRPALGITLERKGVEYKVAMCLG